MDGWMGWDGMKDGWMDGMMKDGCGLIEMTN